MSYSKSQVDRAGRAFADRLRAAMDGEAAFLEPLPETLREMDIVEWWRREHAKPLSRVAANLRYYASEHGRPIVAQRLKKFPTIAGKLVREPNMKLSRMGDVGGVRAVLPTQRATYDVARRVRRNWTITGYRDYISEPKADGYRAIHLINRNRGRLIEVQLRTPSQDSWANAVERLSRFGAPGLKYGHGPADLREYFVVVGDLFAQADQGLEIDRSLMSRAQELQGSLDTLLGGSTDEP